MLSKALEMVICFHRGPILGSREGHSFPRVCKRSVKFLYDQENFYEEFERHVKEGCGKS